MRRGVRLGVDVGTVRVGVATSDPDGMLATPLTTLTRQEARGGDVREAARLVGEHEAVEVVVGLPVTLAGNEGESAQKARAWAAALSREIGPVPVRLVDERLTTVQAHRAMGDSGRRAKERRSHIDQQAAVMILQVALDSERSTGQPAGVLVGGRKPRARRARSQEGHA